MIVVGALAQKRARPGCPSYATRRNHAQRDASHAAIRYVWRYASASRTHQFDSWLRTAELFLCHVTSPVSFRKAAGPGQDRRKGEKGCPKLYIPHERERLARYRHAAGKAVSGKNTGWNREKPVKDKPSKCRRAIAANTLRDRGAHAALCRTFSGRTKYPASRYNTLLASRGNSM